MSEIEDQDNVDRELFKNVEKLRELRIAHRDLDEVISRLSLDFQTDQLQLKRLKKRKLILKDQPVDHFDTIRRKKDGKFIHVSLTISPIKDATGKVIGA